MARTITEKKFATILLEAIDEAFTTLGPSVKLSIYFHLETKFAVSKQDIPDRIGDFTDALETIFGQGARALEILIMKNLNQKVKCHYKWQGPKWLVPDLTFEKYVRLLQLSVEDKGKIGDVEVLLDAGEKPQQRI
ncbi:MAG: hypothetical protein ACQCN6_10945 [Candidatus Bathyarchaeia archaeon]